MKTSKKEILIEKYLREEFPRINFKKLTAGDDKNKIPNHVQYQISKNTDLIKSKYFFESKKEFIHFTTYDSAKLILQNNNLRLYNMYKMNDPREYTYANKDFFNLIQPKENPKENLFLLSMCKPQIFSEDSGIEFNMWRLYADDGWGGSY